MKYAVIKVINGNYFIHTEGFTDSDKAKINYHALCQTLWNADDVQTACVAIIDENFDIVEGYREIINMSDEYLANRLIAGTKTWEEVPASRKNGVKNVLKRRVESGEISPEQYEEIVGEPYEE